MQSNPQAHINPGSNLLFAACLFSALAAIGCAQPPTTICEAGNDECVCEYDGKTYPAGAGFPSTDGCNSCSCDESGQVACTLKACLPVPQACGGLNDHGCPDGQYCDYPVEALCGAADATGVCQVPSEICNDLYAPVCACGDQTFPNACYASRAGKSVAYDGECK